MWTPRVGSTVRAYPVGITGEAATDPTVPTTTPTNVTGATSRVPRPRRWRANPYRDQGRQVGQRAAQDPAQGLHHRDARDQQGDGGEDGVPVSLHGKGPLRRGRLLGGGLDLHLATGDPRRVTAEPLHVGRTAAQRHHQPRPRPDLDLGVRGEEVRGEEHRRGRGLLTDIELTPGHAHDGRPTDGRARVTGAEGDPLPDAVSPSTFASASFTTTSSAAPGWGGIHPQHEWPVHAGQVVVVEPDERSDIPAGHQRLRKQPTCTRTAPAPRRTGVRAGVMVVSSDIPRGVPERVG